MKLERIALGQSPYDHVHLWSRDVSVADISTEIGQIMNTVWRVTKCNLPLQSHALPFHKYYVKS